MAVRKKTDLFLKGWFGRLFVLRESRAPTKGSKEGGWLVGWLEKSLLSYAGWDFHKDGASAP